MTLATAAFLVFVGVAHAWLTLHAFHADGDIEGLLTDEPVLTGRHALHLHHGFLGGEAFRRRHETGAYDPAFFAGYPKTLFFDLGSKPAELTQLFGRDLSVKAYKIGVWSAWSLIPWLMAAGCGLASLGRGSVCLSAVLAALLMQSPPGRRVLENGDLDLALGVGLSLLGLGLLVCYRMRPGIMVWLGLASVLSILTLIQPLMLVGLLPALAVYGLATVARHGWLWHLGLAAALAAGVLLNGPWLLDGLEHCWMLTCPGQEAPPPSLQQLLELDWQSLLPVDRPDQVLAAVLAAGGLGGSLVLMACRRSLAGRLFGTWLLTQVAIFVLVDHLGRAGDLDEMPLWDRRAFLFAALLGGVIPLAGGMQSVFRLSGRLAGSVFRAAVVWVVVLAVAAWLWRDELGTMGGQLLEPRPMALGVPSEVQGTVDALRERTSEAARILWEEEPETAAWSPLLPVWTRRGYVGGLGSAARIEQASIRLADGRLADRPLADWTDAELAEYARVYNIGWIACRSEPALERFRSWDAAVEEAELPTGHRLFLLRRQPSFLLRGEGNLLHWDAHGVTLTDVLPSDGVVDLSFHYHVRITPSNDRVLVDRLSHGFSSIPLLRLRLSGPVSRLTLYWRE